MIRKKKINEIGAGGFGYEKSYFNISKLEILLYFFVFCLFFFAYITEAETHLLCKSQEKSKHKDK